MVVLGIDPGYAIVGYGAIRFVNNTFTPISFGSITTEADMDFNQRLTVIYDDLVSVIRRTKPDALSIEKLYFQTNAKTAIMVAEARGVILLAATKMGVPVYEYTPLQVKVAVTGYGKAQKPQVMEMTRRLLHLKETPKPDDTADALAIAITHTQSAGSGLRRFMIQKGINK
ncbi:MAG: crossover junction endodeoxyribonuclease RuvC [Ruminococcus sp.]|nr:crossover junction endodeoxyribonuclease RuvC [Ruminococcus sp.]